LKAQVYVVCNKTNHIEVCSLQAIAS